MATKKATNGAFADFPFLSADVTKMWSEFQAPAIDVDAMIASQRKNFEAMTAANQTVAEGFQTLARRQAEMAQEALADLQKASQEVLTSAEIGDRAAKQADLVKMAFQMTLANIRELTDMASKSTNETFEVVNKRVVESLDEVKSVLASPRA